MKALVPLLAIASAAIGIVPAIGWPKDRVISSYATPLGGRSRAQRHNAELALLRLDGVRIPAHGEFSFNRRVGTFSRDRGYRRAPVSFDGELIADWGGGVCQTSTTLYNAALLAGMTILERTHHRFAPGYVEPGRDAAVAFPGIDLRFQNPYDFPVRITGRVAGDCLLIEFRADHALPSKPVVVTEIEGVTQPGSYVFHSTRGVNRLRTSGLPGCDVTVYRVTGGRRELISHDSYPPMNRVIESASE